MIHQSSGFKLSFEDFIKSCRTCPDDPVVLRELWALLAPQVIWRDGTITAHTIGAIEIDGEFLIQSAYVAKGLAYCRQVTVMGLTVGARISEETETSLTSGQYYRGTLSDLVGSYGVEQLADRFCAHLQNQAIPRGKYQTLRYSPGYGDWPLSAQKEVMAYLNQCNGVIGLTSNLMLIPEKSITALIGWAHTWQKPAYPEGNRSSSFCNGGRNCAACTTWACRKDSL